MNSVIATVTIKQRLNKLSSFDSSNIKDWMMEEAVNKAVVDYFRRNKHGGNQYKEGDETTTSKTDDFQILIKTQEMSVGNRDVYVETYKLPKDYFYFKRVTPICNKGNCQNISIKSTLIEEANVDEYLSDWSSQPSFDFEETFHTLAANRIKIYHNKDFSIEKVILTYYRKPANITFTNPSLKDQEWEWKDDMAQQLIDEACKILSGDIKDLNTYQITDTRIEKNN